MSGSMGLSSSYGPSIACLDKHLITHKSVAQFSGVSEAGGEIRHSLQALPDGLDSGFAVAFARREAVEHGDPVHDLICQTLSQVDTDSDANATAAGCGYHAGLTFFLQPVRATEDRYDVCLMKQPVEEHRRERCVVGEGLVPLSERRIAGHYVELRNLIINVAYFFYDVIRSGVGVLSSRRGRGLCAVAERWDGGRHLRGPGHRNRNLHDCSAGSRQRDRSATGAD